MLKKIKKLNLKKILPAVVLAVLLLGAIIYLAYQRYLIAATVNGQPIDRLYILSELEKQGGKNVLDSIITEVIIEQEAKKANLSVSDNEIDKEIKNIEASVTSAGATLDQALEQQNMTVEDLRDNVRIQLLVQKLVKSDKITVSDKEVEQYLEDNSEMFESEEGEEPDKKLIKDQLLQQKIQTKIQEYIQSQTSKAEINYFGSYR